MGTNHRTAVAAIAVVTALLTGSATTAPASAKQPKRAKKVRAKRGSVVCHNVGIVAPAVPAADVVLGGSAVLVFGEVFNPVIVVPANALGAGIPAAVTFVTPSVTGLGPMPASGDVFNVTIAANAIAPGIPATQVTLPAVVKDVDEQGFFTFNVTVPAGSLGPPGPVCSSA